MKRIKLRSPDRSRAVASPALPLYFWQRAWQWRYGVLILAIFIPSIYYLSVREAAFSYPPADVAGALVQTAPAVVVNKQVSYGKSNWYTLVFQLNGVNITRHIDQTTMDGVKWSQTEIGSTVTIKYRIGKSGSIWVDDWEPAPTVSSAQR